MFQRKGRIFAAVIAMASLLLLGGCISEEERAQAEEWRNAAEGNAIAYIEEKYGFTAEVVDSKTQKASDLFGTRLTSKTLVVMKYKDKEFSVLSFGEEEHMKHATDNYQKEEILASIEAEINTLFKAEPENITICGGDNEYQERGNGDEFYDMFYRTYYDGTNLEEVALEEPLYILAEYIEDISYEELFAENKTLLFEHRFMHGLFISYENQEMMQKAQMFPGMDYFSIYERAPYIKKAFCMDGDKAMPISIELASYQDFLYMIPGVAPSDCRFEEKADSLMPENWNGHGFNRAKMVNDTAYYPKGDFEGMLYIYYPKEKYSQLTLEQEDINAVVGYAYKEDGEYQYRLCHSQDEIIDYVVIKLSFNGQEDFSFRFMYNDKEEEGR